MSAAPPEALDRARTLVEPALREAVGQLGPTLRTPSTYHLGWTDADGKPLESSGGKGIRSTLAMLGSEAVGGTADHAVPGAVALELVHNFSLVHDDIMDGDRIRRHRPTVWDVYGVGDAIIVGDALHTLAHRVLLGPAPTERSMAATERLVRATAAMIEGQALDVELHRRDRATLDECLEMEAAKTGALLAQSVAIGAVLGGGSPEQIEALETYGAALGLAFQAVDDNLGIWGDAAVTGKPVGNDLRERKKSMPIAIAFDRGGPLCELVAESFATQPDAATIERVSGALEAAGVRAEVASLAERELGRALGALDAVELETAARAELVDLAGFVVNRSS